MRIIFLFFVCFLIVSCGDNTASDGQKIGGDYVLMNQHGEPFSSTQLDDTYQLLYFGFTFCPSICPTELQKMAEAIDMMPKDIAARIQPVFITVDPERDTAVILKDYVAHFHPRLIGLTGPQDDINATLKSYHVYAAKAQDDSASDYMMDHSSMILFIAPGHHLIKIFRNKDSAEYIVAYINGTVR